jgi:hypothetical protein
MLNRLLYPVYIKFSNKRQIFKCDDKLIKQITQPTIQFSNKIFVLIRNITVFFFYFFQRSCAGREKNSI